MLSIFVCYYNWMQGIEKVYFALVLLYFIHTQMVQF